MCQFLRTRGRTAAVRIGFVLALASNALAAPAATKASSDMCQLTAGPFDVVTRVIDAETIELESGMQVRLIGTMPARASDVFSESNFALETKARSYLEALVLGRSIQIAYGGRRRDRYSHELAHVFVPMANGSAPQWVQAEMLSAGVARAYALSDNSTCLHQLLAHEKMARAERRGLWALDIYKPLPAADSTTLMAARSRFVIIEGKIAALARTKSAAYLNFGADYRSDFTIRIGKEVLAAHPDFERTLESLAGQTVSVRGWIERRNGPMIDLVDPAELEVIAATHATAIEHPILVPSPSSSEDITQDRQSLGSQGQSGQQERPGLAAKPPGVEL